MRSLGWIITFFCVLLFVGCEWLPEVGSVRLSESSVTLKVGGSKLLVANVDPANAEYEQFSWNSSDPNIVSVSNGRIVALNVGTAQITASAAGVTSSPCQVTVSKTPVSNVSLDKSSVSILEGESLSLKVTVSPSDATNGSVTWSTGNSKVATVSTTGTITAVEEGETTITAKSDDSGITATCQVTVKAKYIQVTGVSLSQSTLSLKPGGTFNLTASVIPSNATNKDVTWSSSNTSVATVASDGTVTAIAPGTATITVTTADQGKTATCFVTVNAIPAAGITLSNTTLSLTEGENSQLSATVAPDNATNKALSWSSSDTSVAIVADDGTVTAKSAGSATITCSSANGAVKATCSVTVKAKVYPVTGVSLSQTTMTLTEGESSQLTATVSPSNATNKNVTWSSSNTSVATVASDGTVNAKSAGTATITVKTSDQGKTAICTITVKAKVYPVTGVSLSQTSMTLTEGESSQLVATINPSNATNKDVTWSSNNTSVATVASDGTVNAKSAGTATITVKTSDQEKTATCPITVKAKVYPVTGVSLSQTSMTLTEGESSQLTATVTPSNATNTGVSWSSSNTSVATVSFSGVVTAKAIGSATITVKTSDGSKTATCDVTVKASTVSVDGVTLSPTSLSLTVGETSRLSAIVSPSNATNKSVSWSSSNTSVATITANGEISAVKAGNTVITVRTSDNGFTASCVVDVREKWIDFPDIGFKTYIIKNFDVDGDGGLSMSEAKLVTSMDIHSMGIKSIQGIQFLENLEFLNCNSNELGSIDLSANVALKTLYCDSNHLTTLNLTNNDALVSLSCSYNKLTDLNITRNPKLKSLWCKLNSLAEIDLSNNSSLVTLDISWNKLVQLDVSKSAYLKVLRCANMSSLKVLYIYEGQKIDGVTIDRKESCIPSSTAINVKK